MKRLKFIFLYLSFGLSFLNSLGQQIANYVGNGSFEDHCTTSVVKYWPGLDSLKCGFGILASECPGNGLAPKNPFNYQKARSGAGYMLATFFFPAGGRAYLKNRLKSPLVAGETYCAKFYVGRNA